MRYSSPSPDVINYNREGKWSVEGIQQRYRDYCAALQIKNTRELAPREARQGNNRWIFPVMYEVIQGIEESDAACVALGIDFIEEDLLFPFGANLKSRTARALRRTNLTEPHRTRIRDRVVSMLALGVIPHEMREYAKLLRKIGVAEQWPRLERDIPRNNRYAMRFYKTLRAADGLPI